MFKMIYTATFCSATVQNLVNKESFNQPKLVFVCLT